MRLKRGLMRTIVSSGLIIGVVSTTSGCIMVENNGPVQVSVVDGSFAVAFCADLTVESLEVWRNGLEGSQDTWELMWQGEGPLSVHEGEVFTLDASAEGFRSVVEGVTFKSDDSVRYSVQVVTSSEQSQSVFVASEGGLIEGKWIGTQQELASEPCR